MKVKYLFPVHHNIPIPCRRIDLFPVHHNIPVPCRRIKVWEEYDLWEERPNILLLLVYTEYMLDDTETNYI